MSRRRLNIHLPRKNGTRSSFHLLLTLEFQLRLHATNLLDKSKHLTVWKVVFSRSISPTCKTMVKKCHGERWRCKSKKWTDTTATPTSTEWTSPETSFALSWRSGTLWLRLTFKSKLQMDTSSDCSALDSLKEPRDKLRLLATPRTHRRNSLDKRWWRSWFQRSKNLPSRSSPRNLFKSLSQSKFKRNAERSSHSKTSLSGRLRCSRSQSSISPDSWRTTRTSQRPLSKKPQRTHFPNDDGPIPITLYSFDNYQGLHWLLK